MVGVSIPVIMMASVCFYVGFYHLWMYFRRRQEIENLSFSLMCFTITLYDVFCVGLYNAENIAEGMVWQRFQFASLALFAVSTAWFVYFFLKYNSKKPFIYLSMIFFVFIILGLTIHNKLTLSIEYPMPKHVDLCGFVSITYNEVDPGLIYLVQYASLMLGFVYILYLVIKYYKSGNKKHVKPILIALCSFFVASLNDVLVGAAAYPFIYLMEYAYMFIILSMAYGLLNRFVDLHHEVEELNVHLEDKVKKRTAELQAAMEEMEAINEALANTNSDLEEAQRIALRDMNMAVNVQTSLFKKSLDKSGDWEIAYVFKPMAGVSGDLFDFYMKDGELQGVSIFDVSGHGISSGLITLLAKSIFFRNFHEMGSFQLSKIVEKANRELRNEISGVDNYLTGIMLRFEDDAVEYVNAGHSDLLLKRAEKNIVRIVRPSEAEFRGALLGLKDVEGEFNTIKFKVSRNDSLLLFTDALVESKNGEREEFGMKRLVNSFEKASGESAKMTLDYILNSLYNFTGTESLDDDLTAIIIRKI